MLKTNGEATQQCKWLVTHSENVIGRDADASGYQCGTESQGSGIHKPNTDVGQHDQCQHDESDQICVQSL